MTFFKSKLLILKSKTKSIFKRIKKHKILFSAPVAIAVIFSILLYFFILKDLPLPTRLNSSSTPQATQIFDKNGKLLFSIYATKNQTFIPLSSIPKHMQEATIAIEDKDFYRHGAIDIRGISRALYSIIVKKELQGGSTITQQLVKNSLLTPERTIPRKIKEVILAFATEALYSKDKILELYLNQIPYGGTSYGIEAASQAFFGKKAKDLSLAEAALLAGLPEAPTTNSPFGSHPERAVLRQKTILQKMHEQEYISEKELDQALKEKFEFKKVSDNILAPHFSLFVKDLLEKKYGEQIVEEGGLKVVTSLDLDTQEMAEEVVSQQAEGLQRFNASNASALVTDPATGEILAMVGSKDYFNTEIDGNVNITLALRQPGSSIKPINYTTGLIHGYNAATPFVDKKLCLPTIEDKQYCPVNYDGKFRGVVQMRYALGNSINIPAVKMLKVNTVEAMIATASAMGITTFTEPEKYGLSLTLGGGEVTMLEMAQAFGVFANGGYKIDLNPILKITDKKGKTLEEYTPLSSPIFGKKVIPEGVAFIVSDILSDNNARLEAFGSISSLRIPNQTVSVKTGTTNDLRDNWTIGYTPDFVVTAWVGNNDNSPMNSLASGITGAAPIWNEIMTNLLENKPSHPLTRPANVIQKRVCSVSGLLPSDSCETRFEYFIKGTEPRKVDPGLQKVFIDKNTQDLANPGQTENVEQIDHMIVTDVTGDTYCVTCPVKDDP